MAKVIHDTRFRRKAPWLLEQADLNVLDEAFQRTGKLLLEYQENNIRDRAEHYTDRSDLDGMYEARLKQEIERVREGNARDGLPVIEFLLDDRRRIVDNSFAQLLIHPDVIGGRTVAFTAKQRVFDDGLVSLDFNVASGELTISADPPESSAVMDAFNVLRNWAVDREPPRWQQIWSKIGFGGVAFAGFFLAIWSVIGNNIDLSFSHPYTTAAKKLLVGGIDQSKVPQVVELLLRDRYALAPGTAITASPLPVSPQHISPWALALLFIIVCVFVSIPPRPSLGIGRTLRHPQRWRWWIRFAAFGAPGALVSAVLLAKLQIG